MMATLTKLHLDKPVAERQVQARRLRRAHPDRVPTLVLNPAGDLPPLPRAKFLVPSDITLAQFAATLRQRCALKPEKALFTLVGGRYPPMSLLMSQVDREYADEDGFLYVTLCAESTFGH